MTHNPPHTIIRHGSYVYNRRVPKSAQSGFGKKFARVHIGRDLEVAKQLASGLTQKLDEIWASPIVASVDLTSLVSALVPKSLTFDDALDAYLDEKSEGRAVDFSHRVRRMVAALPEAAGNKLIEDYDRQDARAVVQHLASSGMKSGSIRRRLNAIHAVMGHAYREVDIPKRNPFSRLTIPGEGKDAAKRGTFTRDELAEAYAAALASGSEIRLLVPLLGETGARLAEIVGLRRSDVCLASGTIHITPHAGRRLKTRGSEREVPLVGYAEEALTELLWRSDRRSGDLLFQRYERDGRVLATHASNAVNKWLKNAFHGLTAHSLRHTFRDRLREVEAPLEMIDQLGGWSSVNSVGASYGNGYSLVHKRAWVEQISIPVDASLAEGRGASSTGASA